jgi:hypothetical protein
MAEDRKEPNVRMVCERCGSPQVTREAWAEWDEEGQGWQLGAVFDFAYCHRCQRRAHIEMRAI